jgi:hypothetical protein
MGIPITLGNLSVENKDLVIGDILDVIEVV